MTEAAVGKIPARSSASEVGEQQPTMDVQQQFDWYYCGEANAYYLYVRQCPRGWSKVVPSPSGPAQEERRCPRSGARSLWRRRS